MKFLRSAPTLIITTALVAIGAITALAQVLTNRLVSTAHEGDYELMRSALSNTLKAMADEATSDAEIVANIPSVRKAFIARDRAALQAETLGMFRTIEAKYAIDQAQFHLPPGVSFLRLDAPDKFGDDQTSYRPMLAEAHHEKSIRKGTAITKGGPAIFGIVPIVDDHGQFAGSFEMGLEFGPVLKELKTAYGIEGAVFFEEKQLREIATDIEPEVLTPKNRLGKYIRYYATHPELMTAIVTDRDIEITEAKRFVRTVARAPWGVQLLPLYNYANKQIGVVALATSFAEDKTLAGRSLVWQILAGIFACIVVAGAVLVAIRGVLLAPLAALTERMSALAAGDTSKPADPLEDYCEELQSLASSYEKLRGQKQA
ncbi:MAG TPA: cache domain-containing protein [Labilithrix sp.]|nr:cache domain-containing protein [Labilithrix sp.]